MARAGKSEAGSTAEMAKLLGLPVVLVVDASSVARSVAALVHGFEDFDPKLKVQGVIFNKVAGPTHYDLLKDAVESTCNAIPLGYLPGDERIRIPERYLGLFTAGEDLLPDSSLELLAELAEEHLGITKLLQLTAPIPASSATRKPALPRSPVRVGVARDCAFCFYYQDNLDALQSNGAEIVEFSPVEDAALPEGLDALYFGGGYPELYAAGLSANREMLGAVRKFAEAGGAVYAECGGLMYLAEKIVTREGSCLPDGGRAANDGSDDRPAGELRLRGGSPERRLPLGSCRRACARPQLPLFDDYRFGAAGSKILQSITRSAIAKRPKASK